MIPISRKEKSVSHANTVISHIPVLMVNYYNFWNYMSPELWGLYGHRLGWYHLESSLTYLQDKLERDHCEHLELEGGQLD